MPSGGPFAAWTYGESQTAADPGSYWTTGGGQRAEAWTCQYDAYQAFPVYGADYESTDADTSSDDREEVLANPTNVPRMGKPKLLKPFTSNTHAPGVLGAGLPASQYEYAGTTSTTTSAKHGKGTRTWQEHT